MAIVIKLVIWPIVQGVYARYKWNQQVCVYSVLKDNRRYIYEISGIQYVQARQTFWDDNRESIVSRAKEPVHGETTICYVNPSDHRDSVLDPNSVRNWRNAMKPLLLSFFLVLANVFLSNIRLKRR